MSESVSVTPPPVLFVHGRVCSRSSADVNTLRALLFALKTVTSVCVCVCVRQCVTSQLCILVQLFKQAAPQSAVPGLHNEGPQSIEFPAAFRQRATLQSAHTCCPSFHHAACLRLSSCLSFNLWPSFSPLSLSL